MKYVCEYRDEKTNKTVKKTGIVVDLDEHTYKFFPNNNSEGINVAKSNCTKKNLKFSSKNEVFEPNEILFESKDTHELPKTTSTTKFEYKTELSDGFDYYVRVNNIIHENNRVLYECTLKQRAEEQEFDKTFVYPPSNKKELDFFWKNLKK